MNTSSAGAATAFQGSLCQCLSTLTVKNFILISNFSLLSFRFNPLPCDLLPHVLVKKSLPLFLAGSLQLLGGPDYITLSCIPGKRKFDSAPLQRALRKDFMPAYTASTAAEVLAVMERGDVRAGIDFLTAF